MRENILPIAAMEKLLRKGDSSIRVSNPAKEELRIVLEDRAELLAKDAARFALHAGRRTIKAEDVKLAAKNVK
jgi:histone H3/H4